MALTALQRRICRLLADRRIAGGESYVAGGLALNEALGGLRVSRDVDLFHDTNEALEASSASDLEALAQAGFTVELGRQAVGFVEATVRDGGENVEVQWVRESAYRFFPLVLHPDLGLMLHPFDLATNKVLALVGRVAARDWIDIITCHERLSPFGCLAWAASGKDPGLSPLFIVEEAARTTHYPAVELDAVVFDGPPPDRAVLAHTWRHAIADARAIVDLLPPDEVGKAVLDSAGRPFSGDREALERAVTDGQLSFHAGALRGAVPTVRAPGD
jgi:hypothetical protein